MFESFAPCSNMGEAQDGDPDRSKALAALNVVLAREGWVAFYDERGIGQLRHIATNAVAQMANPHRPMTLGIGAQRSILPTSKMFRGRTLRGSTAASVPSAGFHRITAAGHKDKALEYGKDACG
ncbi:MAG: hypothetical protein R3D28_06975 [Geminicoccaceae bacterium]